MKNDIKEEDLINYLQSILNVEGSISLVEFKKRVRSSFNLSDHDLSTSKTRPNECMYEQKCRNLNCHKKFPHNLISYDNCIFKSR